PKKYGIATAKPWRTLAVRSSDGGSKGIPPRASSCVSTRAKPITANGNKRRNAIVHHGQPSAPPSISGISNESSATASRVVPHRSTSGGFAARLSGTERRANSKPTSPIGTLTKKAGRQLVPHKFAATSSPPPSWPTTVERPLVAPYKPSAW